MTTYKDWYIFLGVVALLISNLGHSVELGVTLSDTILMPGQRATLTLTLNTDSHLPKEELLNHIEIKDDLLRSNPALKILGEATDISENNFKKIYEITSYNEGETRIPPIEMTLFANSYSTEQLPLTIKSNRAPNDEALRPSYEEEQLPFEFPTWFLRTLTVCFILISFYYFYRKYLSSFLKTIHFSLKTTPSPISPKENDIEWLKRRLEEIRLKANTESNKALILDELVSVLRQYFSKGFQLPVEAWTTKEIKHHFKDHEIVTKITELFESCDQFRFNPQNTQHTSLPTKCIDTSERILLE